MNSMHTALIIAVAGIVTLLLRCGPFLVWNGERKTPEYVMWLGNVLPYAIMAMLVVYCLKGVNFTNMTELIPAAAGVIITAGLQAWKHNSVYSILAGTVVYMVLIQVM